MVKRMRWILAGIVVLGGLIGWNLHSTRHVLPRILIWPSTSSLAHQILQAAADKNLQAVLDLTDGSDFCLEATKDVYDRLRHNYPEIVFDYFSESDSWYTEQPQIEIVEIGFDREKTSDLPPIYGVLGFNTSYTPLGRRFVCGQGGVLRLKQESP